MKQRKTKSQGKDEEVGKEQRKREEMAREERDGERNRAKCKCIKLI